MSSPPPPSPPGYTSVVINTVRAQETTRLRISSTQERKWPKQPAEVPTWSFYRYPPLRQRAPLTPLTWPGMFQFTLRHGSLPKLRGAHPRHHRDPPNRVDPVLQHTLRSGLHAPNLPNWRLDPRARSPHEEALQHKHDVLALGRTDRYTSQDPPL